MDPLYLVPLITAYLLVSAAMRTGPPLRVLALPLAGLVVVWLMATPSVANSLIGSLEHDYPPDSRCEAAEILVLLAGGIRGRPNDSTDILRLSDASIRRTLAASVWLAERPTVTVLVAGGLGGSATEADIMIELLRMTGVSNSLIPIREPANTRAAALAVAGEVLESDSLALMTSAYHMRRSIAEFSTAGLSACALPVDHRRSRFGGIGSIVPNTGALQKSIISIHEYLGLFASRWTA